MLPVAVVLVKLHFWTTTSTYCTTTGSSATAHHLQVEAAVDELLARPVNRDELLATGFDADGMPSTPLTYKLPAGAPGDGTSAGQYGDFLLKRGGKCVIELRPRMDWHKGAAVKLLVERRLKARGSQAAAGPLMVVTVGDDLTDEDMFTAVLQLQDQFGPAVLRALPVLVTGQSGTPRSVAQPQSGTAATRYAWALGSRCSTLPCT